MSKGAQQADWMIRANFLQSAISSGTFNDVGDVAAHALFKLITNSDK